MKELLKLINRILEAKQSIKDYLEEKLDDLEYYETDDFEMINSVEELEEYQKNNELTFEQLKSNLEEIDDYFDDFEINF